MQFGRIEIQTTTHFFYNIKDVFHTCGMFNKYQNNTTNSSIVFTQHDCTQIDDLHLMLRSVCSVLRFISNITLFLYLKTTLRKNTITNNQFLMIFYCYTV